MTIQSLESEMEKLSEDLYRQGLFDGHHYEPIEWDTKLDDLFVKSATQALLKTVDRYVEELIGEDEILHDFSPKTHKHYFENLDMETRNKLRATLRQQVKGGES